MRPKVVIPILLITAAIVTLALWFARSGRLNFQAPLPSTETVSPVAATSPAITATAKNNNSPALPALLPAAPVSPPETHDEYVTRRSAELMDLAMNDDLDSLNTIVSELNNPDAQIRATAVTATVQFKSPLAIPALQDAYGRTSDPQEKINLAKAIDFLSTPSGSEAAGQTN